MVIYLILYSSILMKVGMALERAKVKPRQPSRQEATKKFKSTYFKHREQRLGRFKEIITSAIPTFILLRRIEIESSVLD